VNTKLFGAAVAAALLCSSSPRVFAHDYSLVIEYDNSTSQTRETYPSYDSNSFTITGRIMRVNQDGDRLIVRTDNNRRFLIDAYGAEVVSGSQDGSSRDLENGDRVRITGHLLGVRFIEAGRVTVLDADQDVDTAPVSLAPPVDMTPAPPPVDVMPAPVPVVVPAPITDRGPTMTVEAVVTSIITDQDQLFIIDDNDRVYRVKADNADIIIPGIDRAGTLAEIGKGARVKVIGETESDGKVILADRIRLVVDAEPTPVQAPPPAPQPMDLSSYTGILIDVRDMEAIQRSPNPSIFDADMNLMYPDRSHVPSPDEVQNESTVRYYRSLDDAKAGVCGDNPLVLHAEMVVGPADDGVLLGADDAALFKELDKRLGYTQNWKVGFLIPTDR